MKKVMVTAPVLMHYDQNRQTQLETDASEGVVSGFLSQKVNEEWHLVAYFSKTMTPAEGNYGIPDKELPAIVKCFEEWRPELMGLQTNTPIRILTDHHGLEFFATKKQLNADALPI